MSAAELREGIFGKERGDLGSSSDLVAGLVQAGDQGWLQGFLLIPLSIALLQSAPHADCWKYWLRPPTAKGVGLGEASSAAGTVVGALPNHGGGSKSLDHFPSTPIFLPFSHRKNNIGS